MMKRKTLTKYALILSILLIAVVVILGTEATLTWFRREDTVVNRLNFGDLRVNLYHKSGGQYSPVDGTTKVFPDSVLYEPGYTQIVYLKIENAGTVGFSYGISVVPDLDGAVPGFNEAGEEIRLQDYLLFGVVCDATEDGLLEKTADRDLAKAYATRRLSNDSGCGGTLGAGECGFCAVILYLPEDVGNGANYRGGTAPSVDVGIGVVAEQIR